MLDRISFRALLGSLLIFVAVLFTVSYARSADNGQWGNADPAVSAWYARQMMPNAPKVSCCGEADAYWADEWVIGLNSKGERATFAIITDNRSDEPLHRKHLAVGTLIEVPEYKFNDSRGDPQPEGHGIIFISQSDANMVYCYIAPGGV